MLTNIKLHGILGKEIGSKWNLKIKSVSEAIHAINILTKDKLKLFFIKKTKENVFYRILVNGVPLRTDIEEKENQLLLRNPNIKNIDIIPILEGNDVYDLLDFGDSFYQYEGWAALFAFGGIVYWDKDFGPVSLAGAFYLVGKTPPPVKFKFIDEARRKSYLLNGPSNFTRENLPVPIGYGRLLVGSAVIANNMSITDVPSNPTEILQ